MSNFFEIEAMFARLLIAAGHVLSESELSEIRSFVDVREYGIALETAVDIFAEEGKVAPAEVVLLVEHLATAMSMEPMPLIVKLKSSGSDPV